MPSKPWQSLPLPSLEHRAATVDQNFEHQKASNRFKMAQAHGYCGRHFAVEGIVVLIIVIVITIIVI